MKGTRRRQRRTSDVDAGGMKGALRTEPPPRTFVAPASSSARELRSLRSIFEREDSTHGGQTNMQVTKLVGGGLRAIGVSFGCGGSDVTGGVGGGYDASIGISGRGGTYGGGVGVGVGGQGGSSVGTGGINGSGGATGGATGADASVTTDAGSIEGGRSCGTFSDPCTSGVTCCSGVCDPTLHTCSSPIDKCLPAGTSCRSPTDCCSLNCGANGVCASTQCLSDGQACTANAACCGTRCSGTCQALNPSCKTAGNTCSNNDQCCSHLCGKDGHCALGGSYCIQTGDICVRGLDCCGGICTKAAGATVGTCSVPAPGATRCSGAVDGTFCNGCGTCCSRLCAPYPPTGVFICQPANGCHIDGDLCVRDQDCCGNDKSLPTSGKNVQCVRESPSDPVGVCRNPMGCSPEGNVCHYRQ